jgi:hypothetical protein
MVDWSPISGEAPEAPASGGIGGGGIDGVVIVIGFVIGTDGDRELSPPFYSPPFVS